MLTFVGISQLRICRPLSSSLGPILMKDAQYAESNEKSIIALSNQIELSQKFIENWGVLSTKMTVTRKIEMGFFIRFRTFRIFHVNLNTFEKKNEDFFFV